MRYFVTLALAGGLSIASIARCTPPDGEQQREGKTRPTTRPATQPVSLPVFVGEKPDEWKSFQEMHTYFLDRFVRSDGFGLSRVERVGDELRFKKLYADGVRYYIGTVQLVSLNDGKVPFIYELSHIDASKDQLRPKGIGLERPRHRRLGPVEVDALKEIQAGKEVVLAGKGEGRELIGAIRAAASCVKCHQVPQDTLLGAFRYPLAELPRE